jgi:hypothetical protein
MTVVVVADWVEEMTLVRPRHRSERGVVRC